MTPLTIGNATEVYNDASRCEILRNWVDHPALADLSRSLRSLIHSLGEEATDEYWRNTLGPIRKLAFTFCSTPLPFAHSTALVNTDWGKINRQVRLCQQSFPDFHERLTNLVQNLQHLSLEANSPLIGPLEVLAKQSGGVSVVIRNSRMNKVVAAYFAERMSLRRARVVSATQLRNAHFSNMIAVIGPCDWHPEYIFSAPRAPTIHVISFRWIRDSWKPGPVFLHNSEGSDDTNGIHRIGVVPTVGNEHTQQLDQSSDIFPMDLLLPMSVIHLSGHSDLGSHADGNSEGETVPARLCYLSGDQAVFVAADAGSFLMIDMSQMGLAAVSRKPFDELETGQYLLLRTSGGGDFIVPLADRILGDSASKFRAEQAEWKDNLVTRAIERYGVNSRRELSSRLCIELQSRGHSQVRPENVHYWMSSKCIRPRKIEDFIAILTYAGLENRAQELWSSMGEIDRAHRRAGHLIRRMLLQKIANTSLDSLERDGEISFDLGDHGGGMLSALQIIDISEEEFEVSVDRIGVLLDLEESSWLA